MRFTYLLLLGLVLSLCSCEEEKLTPSFSDEDRIVELLDLSQPLVKKWKESYDVNILCKFDDTLDFKFGLWRESTKSNWANLSLSKVDEKDVDGTLALFEEFVLKYFKDTIVTPDGRTVYPDFKKKYFPKRILLLDTLENNGTLLQDSRLYELDNRPGKTLRASFNGYEQVVALSTSYMPIASDEAKRDIRDEILYDIIANIFERHSLYRYLPEELFANQVDLYGADVNELAAVEIPDRLTYYRKVSGQWVARIDTNYYDPSWFIGKGFATTRTTPYSGGGVFIRRLKLSNTLTFPLKGADVRNLMQVMICDLKEKETFSLKGVDPVQDYYLKSPEFKKRMRILITSLYEYGIDVFAINPEMELFFQD